MVLVSWHCRDANGATVTSWPPAAAGLKHRIGRSAGERARMRLHYSASDLDICFNIWVWINTYENTIFSGMNIHKSQLFWCELQGYYWFCHTAIWRYTIYEELNYFVVQWIAIYQDFVHQCMNMCRTVHVNKSMSCENYNILCIYIYMYMCIFWKTPVDIHDISMMGFYRDVTNSRFSSIMRKQRSPLATSWFWKSVVCKTSGSGHPDVARSHF